MFLGSYRTSFDRNSRRIALPKKIRSYLAKNEVILSFGFEKCIFGFDPKSWERESKKEFQKSITEKSSRDIRRFLFSAAERVVLDDQGRFIIPSQLLFFAQIKKPIIIGSGDHFEIWDESLWGKYKNKVSGAL